MYGFKILCEISKGTLSLSLALPLSLSLSLSFSLPFSFSLSFSLSPSLPLPLSLSIYIYLYIYLYLYLYLRKRDEVSEWVNENVYVFGGMHIVMITPLLHLSFDGIMTLTRQAFAVTNHQSIYFTGHKGNSKELRLNVSWKIKFQSYPSENGRTCKSIMCIHN